MKHFKIIFSMAIAVFSFIAVNAQSSKVKTNKVAADTVAYQAP